MADALPGTLRLPTRDAIIAKFQRDYKIRKPDAQVGPGTQPYIDAVTIADQLQIVYYDAQVIANGTTDRDSSGTWLDQRGAAIGVLRGEATGGSGFVTISASAGGRFIDAGTEIRHKKSRLRFRVTVGATYLDGAEVPIEGIDTGPATNLDAGELMEWTSPPEGIGPTAVVFENSDGTGLTGGRAAQQDPEYRDALAERRANPPASGNDAAYQDAVLHVRGIGIQQAFTYPAIRGPGTTAIAFTLRPATPGASRAPNAAQIAQVEAELKAQFPADDGIFVCSLIAQPVTVVLRATWAAGAAAWADVTPWPAYYSPTVKVKASPSPTATSFTLATTASTPANPAVGNSIGFYNATSGRFVIKRILAVSTSVVSGETRWAITCDTTNNASDTGYTPVAGQLASPWSDSLNLVSPAIVEFFDATGPGEQVATFYDAGTRQKRQPETDAAWPNKVTNRILAPVFDLPSISDVVLSEPSVPFTSTVGTPGVESYILTLGDLAVMKQ